MKNILLTTIAAVLLVGCGESQQSAPTPESKPVEPVAKAEKPEPPTAKAPDIDIHDAAGLGKIEAVKQHLAASTDVELKDDDGMTPLHHAARAAQSAIVKLLVDKGANVNAIDNVSRFTLSLSATPRIG
jgi:ankyrin repeat protein